VRIEEECKIEMGPVEQKDSLFSDQLRNPYNFGNCFIFQVLFYFRC